MSLTAVTSRLAEGRERPVDSRILLTLNPPSLSVSLHFSLPTRLPLSPLFPPLQPDNSYNIYPSSPPPSLPAPLSPAATMSKPSVLILGSVVSSSV